MSRGLRAGSATPALLSTCRCCSAAMAPFQRGGGAAIFQRACVSAEFRRLASNESFPMTKWFRSLAWFAHGELAVPASAPSACVLREFCADHDVQSLLLAPMFSELSLPLNNPASIEIGPDEARGRPRAAGVGRSDLLAYRFAGDSSAWRNASRPTGRARPLFHRAGSSKRGQYDLAPSSSATSRPAQCRHRAPDRRGRPPTIVARDEIFAFFRHRLAPA